MNGRASFPAALILFVATSFTPSSAAVLTVRQDGTGQYTTINDAKNAASPNDVIEVGPGVYAEEVDMPIPLSLISTHGPSVTILDGETIRRILVFRSGSNSLEGFTVRRGHHVSAGGGLRVQGSSTYLLVNDCVFEENTSDFDGSAFVVRDAGTVVDLFDCAFVKNRSARHCAALMILNGRANFYRCRFEGNIGVPSSAIAKASGAAATIVDCVFVDNVGGVTIWMGDGTSQIMNNTFVRNTGSAVYLAGEYTEIERNIIAGSEGGYGIYYNSGVSGFRSCNVYWENDLGALNVAPELDDVEGDPLFCNPSSQDFTISSNSPAAPGYSSCSELVGALPVACDIGDPPPPPPVVEPVIISILDVPNDEGRQVRIRWERASYDAPNQPHVITGYGIYRRQDASATSPPPSSSAAPVPGDRTPHLDGWDFIASVPARGDDIYQYVAPTLCDKPIDGDPCWSVFFVSAMTPNPLVYFDSAPDSGYSVDNLPPEAPAALVVTAGPQGNALAWEPSESPDVVVYQIYRSTTGVPSAATELRVFSTPGTEWIDGRGVAGAAYTVTAVDRSGNESEGVSQEAATGAGGPVPGRAYLAQNTPNPFNPSTTIEFGVPAGGGLVRMDIFDVAGRRVRSLLDEQRSAGVWRVTWDGRTDAGTRVSSGVYFCRLRVGSAEQTRRMTLIE